MEIRISVLTCSHAYSLTGTCNPNFPRMYIIVLYVLIFIRGKKKAEVVLKRFCRRIRLGAVACIRVLTGQPAQVLHRDDDEWPLQLLSDVPLKPSLEIEVTALWAISDFTVYVQERERESERARERESERARDDAAHAASVAL